MADIRITAGPFSFTARFERAAAPRTCAEIRQHAAVPGAADPRAVERQKSTLMLTYLGLSSNIELLALVAYDLSVCIL